MRGAWLAAVWCLLAGCSGGGGGSAGGGDPSLAVAGVGNVRVSWAPNRETAVNGPGGGYRVYHAPSPDFALDGAEGVVDVPYASGARAPTAAILSLPSGTHYLKVVAYSTINPTGSGPSAEIAVVVP
ncbi:hypothetical protein SVA_3721 [Sulfurifustis variabilis]|uniref:Fibronectin type-III domain-containing protein n=1 Tax=Sulfurifustis variabilis TaxID=1675686 RepID=A0A1C7AFT2_9GAMM|nr:hypothetical protein [Sulfurifustis variabilis]BAU50255.1 hypothetical protein SVA_3721 [Sulfurifustis variabilis]